MTLPLLPRLKDVLGCFPGRNCVGFVAGAGSVIHLEFEPRRPRITPINNPFLSEQQRLGVAEYSIFVECTWRLDSTREVVCGAWDVNALDGPKLQGLQNISGQQVVAWALREPCLDLDLCFANGWTFRIFCDQVQEGEEYANYSVASPTEILIVGAKSHLGREDRIFY